MKDGVVSVRVTLSAREHRNVEEGKQGGGGVYTEQGPLQSERSFGEAFYLTVSLTSHKFRQDPNLND